MIERIRRAIRAAIVDNWSLKLVSVLFAIGCFAYFNGAQNAQRSLQVSVVVLLPKEQLHRALLTQPPPSVRVTLKGPRASLDEIRAEDLGTVQLDVHRGTEAFAVFDTSDLRIPAGVQALVEPPGIDLVWDDVVTLPRPIQIPVTGDPAKGFAIQGEPTGNPTTVQAHGPKTIVETIQHARTEAFDVTGLTEGTQTRKLAIDAPPAHVTYDVQSTTATLQIGKARMERIFTKVPVQVVGATRTTSVPAEVDVRVVGPPEVVSALRPDQVVPVADLKAAGIEPKGSGSATIGVEVTLEGCATQAIPGTVVAKW